MSTQLQDEQAPGRLTLGTSGFAYEHWRDVFYPKGTPQTKWLEFYAERFSAVELNVSFYRLPKRESFEGWAMRTPADFEFVVKGSRTITHYRRLRDTDEQLAKLVSAARGLGDKLSCMLWQLPPHSSPDIDVLDRFCSTLAEQCPALRHAFEFRDPSWFADEVLEVLRSHACALVIAAPGPEGAPITLTAPFTYLRFHHGAGEGGGFTTEELQRFATLCRSWLEEGTDVFAFFNNDPGGMAPRDADEFRALVLR